MVGHFSRVGPALLRPVTGILRHPSISATLPGSTYATELWDWDTYWTSRGLLQLARRLNDAELLQRIAWHAQGSLFNFFDHQAADGRIPIMMTGTNPDTFGCLKTSSAEANHAKPIFGQLALLIADALKNVQWFESRFDQLLRFQDAWRDQYQTPIGLLVWGNDLAIGVDNDPTTFGRPSFSSANLMLNCLYHQDLLAAAEIARRLNRPHDEAQLNQRAGDLGSRIQKYCWDPRDGFYYTVDVQCVDRRAELIPGWPMGMPTSWQCLPLRVQMFTGFLPLWCKLAEPQQAADLVKRHYLNEQTFHAAFGVRTLSARETMHSIVFSNGNPSNWLGPIWLVANYLVWRGLKAYQFEREAAELADKTLRLLAADISSTGTLHEYYHPDTGAPLSHAGFMDWNLLVLEMV